MVKLRCREIQSLYCRELSGTTCVVTEKCLMQMKSCKQTEKWCTRLIATVGTEEQLHRETGATTFYCFFKKSVNYKILRHAECSKVPHC